MIRVGVAPRVQDLRNASSLSARRQGRLLKEVVGMPAITPEEVVALQRLRKAVDWCQENYAAIFFTDNPIASAGTTTFGRVQVRVGIKIVGRNTLEDATEDMQRWLRQDGRTQLGLVLDKEK